MTKVKSPQVDEDKIASELKSNTLRVYWHLLRSPNGVVGVGETQKSLGFSSPALAVYHLEKLAELRLIEKVRGEYHRKSTPTPRHRSKWSYDGEDTFHN